MLNSWTVDLVLNWVGGGGGGGGYETPLWDSLKDPNNEKFQM